MVRKALSVWLVVLVASCAPTAQDRVREFTTDGLHLYQRGAYAPARDQFQAALTLQPNDPDLLFNLGRCSDRLGQTTEAEQFYRTCLKQNTDHAEARYGLTVLLVKRGERKEAVTMAEEWLRARPQLAAAYVVDGWLRAQEGDVVSARARLQQALDLEPRNVRALTELADVFEKLKRPDRALLLYERSLEVEPDQPEVRKKVAELKKKGTRLPQPD